MFSQKNSCNKTNKKSICEGTNTNNYKRKSNKSDKNKSIKDDNANKVKNNNDIINQIKKPYARKQNFVNGSADKNVYTNNITNLYKFPNAFVNYSVKTNTNSFNNNSKTPTKYQNNFSQISNVNPFCINDNLNSTDRTENAIYNINVNGNNINYLTTINIFNSANAKNRKIDTTQCNSLQQTDNVAFPHNKSKPKNKKLVENGAIKPVHKKQIVPPSNIVTRSRARKMKEEEKKVLESQNESTNHAPLRQQNHPAQEQFENIAGCPFLLPNALIDSSLASQLINQTQAIKSQLQMTTSTQNNHFLHPCQRQQKAFQRDYFPNAFDYNG